MVGDPKCAGLVAGEACGRFAGLMEIRAIYERPHAFCLWSADGQTNRGGVSPQGFRTVRQVWGTLTCLNKTIRI